MIVITGGASGIGAAMATAFAACGGKIALLDFDRESLGLFTRTLQETGADVFSHPCDVSDQNDCCDAVEAVIRHWGRIDILINNAGITQRGSFLDTEIPVFRKVMEVNFFGSLYCTKAALPAIIAARGAIVVIESVAGVTPLPGRTGYCASKHALHGMFATLRTELRPAGVHVMNVCPGFIRTNLQSRALGVDGSIADTPRSTVGKDYTPDMVAAAVIKGLLSRRKILALTPAGKLGYWINRISPALFERIIEKQIDKG